MFDYFSLSMGAKYSRSRIVLEDVRFFFHDQKTLNKKEPDQESILINLINGDDLGPIT